MNAMDAWKCYSCNHVGRERSFSTEDGHLCPKCKSEDSFPLRMYECKACGHVADQDFWFPEHGTDDDPLKDNLEPIQCEECAKKLGFDAPEPLPASLKRVSTPLSS